MVDYQYEKERRDAQVEADEEYIKDTIEFVIQDLINFRNSSRRYTTRDDAIAILKKTIKGVK